MRRLSCPLNQPIQSLTRMESSKMPEVRGLRAVSTGCSIFSMELLPSSTPTSKIISETTRPARYSMRPWPKGWSASAFWPASRNPTSVTTEEAASVRLLNASAVTEIAPASRPAISLPANRNKLRMMPVMPASVPYRRRTMPSSSSSTGPVCRSISLIASAA